MIKCKLVFSLNGCKEITGTSAWWTPSSQVESKLTLVMFIHQKRKKKIFWI